MQFGGVYTNFRMGFLSIWLLYGRSGVENAFEAAPAAIVGFIDMFIPALLAINIPSIATRWMIAVLSLVQIIFMTEVGVLAMQTDAGLNVKIY